MLNRTFIGDLKMKFNFWSMVQLLAFISIFIFAVVMWSDLVEWFNIRFEER